MIAAVTRSKNTDKDKKRVADSNQIVVGTTVITYGINNDSDYFIVQDLDNNHDTTSTRDKREKDDLMEVDQDSSIANLLNANNKPIISHKQASSMRVSPKNKDTGQSSEVERQKT